MSLAPPWTARATARPLALALALAGSGLALGCEGPAGPPVEARALCGQIASIVCEADERCFHGTEAPSHCRAAQARACEESVGALAADPRLGYDAARAGAFVAGLRERAQGCFQTPVDLDAFRESFAGTGGEGATCTPASTSSRELLLASLSCGGLACRVQLRADASVEGVCRARRDGACSHPWDCEAGAYCSLPRRWQPGVWGECRPRQRDGWACTSDLECESLHCDGTCRAASEAELALVVTYPALIRAAAPAAYFRMDDASGARRDELGGTPAAAAGGAVTRLAEGAIAGDEDGAAVLSGGSYLRVPSPDALADADALALEGWFRADEPLGAEPLLELASEGTYGVGVGLGDDGTRVAANFRDAAPEDHVAASASGAIAANAWHHVVATYEGRVGTLYVDGRSVASVEVEGPLALGDDLLVGYHRAYGDAEARSFTGAIDEVAVYAHALDPSVIARHFAAGSSGALENRFSLFAWTR